MVYQNHGRILYNKFRYVTTHFKNLQKATPFPLEKNTKSPIIFYQAICGSNIHSVFYHSVLRSFWSVFFFFFICLFCILSQRSLFKVWSFQVLSPLHGKCFPQIPIWHITSFLPCLRVKMMWPFRHCLTLHTEQKLWLSVSPLPFFFSVAFIINCRLYILTCLLYVLTRL